MQINKLLNSSDQAPRHSRSPSVASTFSQASAPYLEEQRRWTTSPGPLYRLAPISSVAINALYTTSSPAAHRTSPSYSAASAQTSPCMSTTSTMDAPSPGSSRSSPPMAMSSPRMTGMWSQDKLPSVASHDAASQQRSSHQRERREFRPTYQVEEGFFIWYHRVDRDMEWPAVQRLYNAQFPDRQRKGLQGIQCKYYRTRNAHGVKSIREKDRAVRTGGGPKDSDTLAKVCPHIRYPWMNKYKGPRM